jgi:hypothetical protein
MSSVTDAMLVVLPVRMIRPSLAMIASHDPQM